MLLPTASAKEKNTVPFSLLYLFPTLNQPFSLLYVFPTLNQLLVIFTLPSLYLIGTCRTLRATLPVNPTMPSIEIQTSGKQLWRCKENTDSEYFLTEFHRNYFEQL